MVMPSGAHTCVSRATYMQTANMGACFVAHAWPHAMPCHAHAAARRVHAAAPQWLHARACMWHAHAERSAKNRRAPSRDCWLHPTASAPNFNMLHACRS
jgi:hypothetical protein